MIREFTLAIDRYDRHIPFFDGTVKAPGNFRYRPLQVGQTNVLRDGTDRHGEMIHHQRYDVAEFSLSTFLMAIERGVPLIGVPIFPRRLFSQSCMFVRADADIERPADLIGRRVGLVSFQTTLSLLARGDLKFEYDVEWERIIWVCSASEKIEFKAKPGVTIETVPNGTDLGLCLARGEIDCIIMPHPPSSIMKGDVKTRRLFRDLAVEERRYFEKLGYWPIMHVLAMRPELVKKNPELPAALFEMFQQAHELCEDYYTDPNWSCLPSTRSLWESSLLTFGSPWKNGFRDNRANIARFIDYSLDQGLISERYEPERLFVDSTLCT